MKGGIDEVDRLQWCDLDERERINLCCDVIRGDDGYFSDALVDLTADCALAHCLALLRCLHDEALGRLVRESVLEICKPEVERRLADGRFYPWEQVDESDR